MWEEAKRRGDDAIKRLIDEGLKNTSVTAVLIGAETATRPWVLYEVRQSMERGNGILGVRVHGIADFNRQTDVAGQNPLDRVTGWLSGREIPLSRYWATHDWVTGNGYQNLPSWVETAAIAAGK